ncbi:MAG: competence protein ComEC [Zhongshania sp.]|jgi:competence protein ComEC
MLSWMTAAIVGFIALAFSPALPSYFTLVIIFCLSVLLHLSLRSRLSSAVLAFAVALSYASCYGHWRVALLLPEVISSSDFIALAEVKSVPERREGFTTYYRFDALVLELNCVENISHPYCDHSPSTLNRSVIQLNWYADSPPQLGNVFKATLRLRQAHGYQSPAAFDYGRWMFASGYSASGYVRNPEQVVYLGTGNSQSFTRVRQRVIAHIGDRLDTYRHSNIMKALLFADRSDIERQQWQIFSRTGTSHLMAISGMHIGIVLAWGLLLGRVLGLLLPRINSLIIGAGMALCFAVVYAALAGFSVPTQRALIMAVVALTGFVLRRNISPWQAYAAAMLLVLIIDPLAPHRAGFTLSFAAVGVLLFAFQGRRPNSKTSHQLLAGIFRSQWVVLLGLIPLLMMWGYGLNPLSFPLNLIAIPLVTLLILPLLFCGLVLLGVAPALANLSWRAADALLDVLLNGLAVAADIFPQVYVAVAPLSLGLASIAILVLLLPRGFPARWLAILPLLAIFLAPAPRPDRASAWVTVLDVGQGLSVLVQTSSKALLYDVGPDFSSGFNTADAVVLPALRSFGVGKLAMLVVSHADRDHAGAAPALLDEVEVSDLRLGETVAALRRAAVSCHKPSQWDWDGVHFEFLTASVVEELSGNNASCVLRITAGGASMLLTGDIESTREQQLINNDQALSAALLIAPHHGSNTSSSKVFIKAVSPEQVVFSAGRNNHYGHPAAAVTTRFQQMGAGCWSTAYHGSIRFHLGASGMAVDQIWGGGRYYWETKRYSSPMATETCSNLQSER